MSRRAARGPRSTTVAFGVIIVFLVAQVAWWLWFQADYIGRVTVATEEAWTREADLANLVAAAQPSAAEGIAARMPHLTLAGGSFAVDDAALAAFAEEQRRALRMFRFEGVFFVLVVMTGLWILARSLSTARELERRQRNFVLAVTHEFRTPISAMRLLIETLQMRRASPERLTEYLSRMEQEVERLERSSDQVLASARLEQLSKPADRETFDLNELVPRVIDAVRSGFETRGAEIEVRPAAGPLRVNVQPEAFELVLTNLLDNAVKYSPGPVKPIGLRLVENDGSAQLLVEDEGVGVPGAEVDKVFDRFYRPGSEMTRRSQGVGLGLYLVRSNVESMGGRVSCEPRDDGKEGTRFVVTLPLSTPQEPTAPASSGAKRKV